MNIHELKTLTVYFNETIRLKKAVEIRRDDRSPRFQVGDLLVLREVEEAGTDPFTRGYTGRIAYANITHVVWGGDAAVDYFPPGFNVPAPE